MITNVPHKQKMKAKAKKKKPPRSESKLSRKNNGLGKKQREGPFYENTSGQRDEMFRVLFDQVSDSIFILELKKGKERDKTGEKCGL
jgi:hypothetical protein